jgi:hypothetical protein
MLLLVILGALALAGLTASIIYRFGHRRRTVRINAHERRAAIRESFDNAPKPPWAGSVTEKTAPHIEKAAPRIEKAAPHIKKAAPHIEKAAPRIEKTALRIEKTAPRIEKTAPRIEKTAPQSYAARSAAQTGTAQERYANIEEILAQLVKHTQQSDA